MVNPKFSILLAEDDLNLGMLLLEYLESEGFLVKLCKDGEIALKSFHQNHFDLCLLDVMMPKKDGFSLAKEIRTLNNNIPIIFITAKSLKEDKFQGYTLGADDYITKPFDEQELLWKIKAITRRVSLENNSAQNSIFSIGIFLFDFKNQSLTANGKTKRITQKESEIIHYFFKNQNRLIKREEMLKDLWGENDYFLGRSLDVFISKIRKLFKDDPSINIENIFSVGFIFNTQSKKD